VRLARIFHGENILVAAWFLKKIDVKGASGMTKFLLEAV